MVKGQWFVDWGSDSHMPQDLQWVSPDRIGFWYVLFLHASNVKIVPYIVTLSVSLHELI